MGDDRWWLFFFNMKISCYKNASSIYLEFVKRSWRGIVIYLFWIVDTEFWIIENFIFKKLFVFLQKCYSLQLMLKIMKKSFVRTINFSMLLNQSIDQQMCSCVHLSQSQGSEIFLAAGCRARRSTSLSRNLVHRRENLYCFIGIFFIFYLMFNQKSRTGMFYLSLP